MIKKALRGVKVDVTHRGTMHRKNHISGLTSQATRELIFPVDKETADHNAYNEDPYAKEFGTKISEKLALVEARVLPAPWLNYQDTGREKDCLPRVGQWNMMNKKMVNGGRVTNWTCINFAQNVEEGLARGFCHEPAPMCQISGMEFAPELVLCLLCAHSDQVERALKAHFHDEIISILQPHGKDLDLVIIILPDNNGSLYGDLKRICEDRYRFSFTVLFG